MSSIQPPPHQPPEWVPPSSPPHRHPPVEPAWPPPRSMPVIVERRGDDLDDLLLVQRIVLATGPLDAALADQVVARLLLLDQRDPGAPIALHMSCSDADLASALEVAATLDLIRAETTAVAKGSVAGAAVAAFCAANRRLAHGHALFVLTEPREDLAGDARHLAVEAEQHAHRVSELHERIASRTGRDVDQVAADLRAGRVLPAEEAAAYGLVDEVIGA